MEVKIWLKEQRIQTVAYRTMQNEPLCITIGHTKSVKVMYETDLSVAEGLDTFYKVAETFLYEKGFDIIHSLTIIDNGTFYSFELELDKNTEVYNAKVIIPDEEEEDED